MGVRRFATALDPHHARWGMATTCRGGFEEPRGTITASDHPPRVTEDGDNVLAFGFCQRASEHRRRWRRHGSEFREWRTKDSTSGHDDGTFDDVLEFTNVAGPVVALQHLH